MLMAQAAKDLELLQLIRFISDFMRQVIENGNVFSKNHFFLMLLHLSPEEVTSSGHLYCKPVVRMLGVTDEEFG